MFDGPADGRPIRKRYVAIRIVVEKSCAKNQKQEVRESTKHASFHAMNFRNKERKITGIIYQGSDLARQSLVNILSVRAPHSIGPPLALEHEHELRPEPALSNREGTQSCDEHHHV